MNYRFKQLTALCFACLTLAACSSNADLSTPTQPSISNEKGYQTYIATGQYFKQNTFTDINDKTITLGDNNKLVILFATWCSDSQRIIKQLQASPVIHNQQLQIIGIGREETPDSLAQFADAYNIKFSLVADPERAIYNQYANKGVPRLILLDKHNKVVKTLIGEDPNTLQNVVW